MPETFESPDRLITSYQANLALETALAEELREWIYVAENAPDEEIDLEAARLVCERLAGIPAASLALVARSIETVGSYLKLADADDREDLERHALGLEVNVVGLRNLALAARLRRVAGGRGWWT